MRTISCKLEDLKTMVIHIGYESENDYTSIRIDAGSVFAEYPQAVPALKVQPPKGSAYPAIVTRDGNIVIWNVKASDTAHNGNGEGQLTFTEGEVVKKGPPFKIVVHRSLQATGTAPDPIQDFIDEAEGIVQDAEEAAEKAEAAASHAPMIGLDGYWYRWDAEAEEYVSTGTQAQGPEGEPGQPGEPGDPTELIDDTAGTGTTGKTWSADKLDAEKTSVLNTIDGMTTATASDVGKALSPKTVANGKVTEWQFVEGGGGSVDPQDIEDAVDAWLTENISNPDSPPLDRSLSSSSSAAPADLLGAVSRLEGTQTSGLLTPFEQGSISESTGEINTEDTSYCYYGKVDVKSGNSVTYTRYNSKITYTAYIALYNAAGQFIRRDSFLPDTTVNFNDDGQFAIICGRNNATLEEAIESASQSFTATLSSESDIVKKVKGIDKQIEDAEEEVTDSLLPQIVGITNYTEMTDNAKSVIKSVILYDADLSKVYTLGAIQKSGSSLQLVIYRMTSQMTQDAIVSRYNSDNYNGEKIVHLGEVTNSGITADIAVDWSDVNTINETGKNYVIDPSAYRVIRSVEHQNVLLPGNIYIRDDTNPMQLFPKNLLKSRNKDTKEFNSDWFGYSSCQKLDEDVVNLSYSDSGADMAVTMKIQNSLSGMVNTIGSKTVHVNPVSISTPFSKKILCIGDSFFDYPWYTSQQSGTKTGKGIMSFLNALATADGNTLDFIGTHLSYTDDETPYYSESYGGWMESWFVSSDQHNYEGNNIYSPFYINSTPCNFSAYFTNLGETPDIVLFFLGMNGNYSASTGEGIADMIEAIQAVSQTTKFLVCTIPPYFNNRYLYGYSLIAGDVDRYNSNNKYLTLFDGKESQGIYVCPVNAIFNAEHHFIQTETAWLNYSSEKVNVVTNHHPNQIGVKVLADNIYSVICGMFA